ncbi:MAG: hypothetical protein ACI86P_002700, partial [Flavobacteriales bacterium]
TRQVLKDHGRLRRQRIFVWRKNVRLTGVGNSLI